MLYKILQESMSTNQIVVLGVLFAGLITMIALKCRFSFLPQDQGRAYAVNGELSKGKIRGVGLVMIICYLLASIIFAPIDKEYLIYALLLFLMMLSGYLDDASKTPWSDYKKGLIDLLISIAAMVTFVMNNETTFYIFKATVTIPPVLFAILGIILIWVSVNVTNCTDGVDGLCTSVSIVTILSFVLLFDRLLGIYSLYSLLFVAVMIVYLIFNVSPSTMLMGDAGSRAIGFFIAILAMKSLHPLSFIPLALVLIIDGGLGLVKVFLLRFLKIHILKNTRTPIHDELRKNRAWSDTQVVYRFVMIQTIIVIVWQVLY